MVRPPAPRGHPLLGHTLLWVRGQLAFALAAARAHGDVVRLDFPGLRTVLVVHPDDIERVLVRDHASYVKDKITHGLADVLGSGLLVSEGALWRERRRLAQPAFHHKRLVAYAGVMVRRAEAARLVPGTRCDLRGELMRLTLGIVGETLLGAEVDGDAEEVARALDVIMDEYLGLFGTGFRLPLWLPTPGNLRFRRARARIDAIMRRLIGRRAEGTLLEHLREARDEAGRGLSEDELRDEVVTLFLAGHETTALALTFAFHLLARHPEAEARLHAELDAVLGGRAPTLEDARRLPFAEGVVHEALRLYPPAWGIGREAITDTVVGGYPIARGTQILIMQWVTQRDARFFPEPDAFRPERWEGDLARRLPRFAYFPFGGGPRVCIGNGFAHLEAVLTLASIAQRVRLRLEGEALPLVPTVTLRPAGPVWVRVEAR